MLLPATLGGSLFSASHQNFSGVWSYPITTGYLLTVLLSPIRCLGVQNIFIFLPQSVLNVIRQVCVIRRYGKLILVHSGCNIFELIHFYLFFKSWFNMIIYLYYDNTAKNANNNDGELSSRFSLFLYNWHSTKTLSVGMSLNIF